MRSWMNEGRSYMAPVGLGEVMRAIGLGRVVASNDPSLRPGDFARGLTGVQDYAVMSAKNLNKVDPNVAPLPRYPTDIRGPKNYLSLLVNSARMEGFIVFNYIERYGEGIQALAGWLAEEKIKAKEDIVGGLENFPQTFLKLFRGENFGKLMIRVAEE
jgi:NADPH-dependent curcumin reductase CurA